MTHCYKFKTIKTSRSDLQKSNCPVDIRDTKNFLTHFHLVVFSPCPNWLHQYSKCGFLVQLSTTLAMAFKIIYVGTSTESTEYSKRQKIDLLSFNLICRTLLHQIQKFWLWSHAGTCNLHISHAD